MMALFLSLFMTLSRKWLGRLLQIAVQHCPLVKKYAVCHTDLPYGHTDVCHTVRELFVKKDNKDRTVVLRLATQNLAQVHSKLVGGASYHNPTIYQRFFKTLSMGSTICTSWGIQHIMYKKYVYFFHVWKLQPVPYPYKTLERTIINSQ